MRAARILAGSLLAFLLVEVLIFDTNLYPSVLLTDSSAGSLELSLHNERRRKVTDRNQVLAIGDSRMGFLPRYANLLTPELGYTFATIATPGTTPRCWYYMLRAVDPTARRYAAIVIPVENYDDAETWEDHANRMLDLHFLIAHLRWTDIPKFSDSFHATDLKWRAALSILLKGSIYKTDLQDFLRSPKNRLKATRLARRESHNWLYDYVGNPDNVTGFRVDWANHTFTAPASFTSDKKTVFQERLLDPQPPPKGQRSAYLKYWFAEIYKRYRGSGTRIIFVRLPRGPFVRPDAPPVNPHSSVRELAAMPEVILDREHYFDRLENPEMFFDAMHLNAAGGAEFSRMLAMHVRELLGPSSPESHAF
jgi:hypothetical protein